MGTEETKKYINYLLECQREKITPYYSTIKDCFGFLIL